MLLRSLATALLCALPIANAVADEAITHDFKSLLAKLPIAENAVTLQKRPIVFQGKELAGQHDCFWLGPVYAGAFNIAYPDGGAVYWPTVFEMPADAPDAYLEIRGGFPQARYMSFNTYTGEAAPYDNILDANIAPDEGATNPYLTGVAEGVQTYTLKVMQGPVPTERAPNTIYLGTSDEMDPSPILLRHYIPETGDDLTGGAELPKVTLVMPDGTRLEGEDMCSAVNSPAEDDPARTLYSPALLQSDFDEMLKKPAVAENYLNTKHEDWAVFWDPRINLMGLMSPRLQEVMKTAARVGFIPKGSGFYANRDNQYVSINLNDKFGDVVVLEAELPRTPATGAASADTAQHDLRYWSLCTNESLVTTRFSACTYDSELALDTNRRYRIVISKAENRPANATAECGATWLDWGDAGDGAGHPGITSLLLRNMAPNPDFGHAVQDIPGPGLEVATMGKYLPPVVYTTRAAFEAKGC